MKAKPNRVNARKQEYDRVLYLANLVNNISDALISTDMKFNILEWNTTAENMYGWSTAEVIGHPVNQFIHSEYVNTNRENVIQKVLEQGCWKGEVTQNRKDGTRFPVLVSVSLVKDKRGNPVGFVTINRDITERKQVETALIESEQRYSLLFDKSVVPAALLKLPDVVIIDANDALEKLTGYTRQEMHGKTAVDLGITTPAHRSNAITNFKKHGSLYANETYVFTRSGEERIVLINTNQVELKGQRYAVSTMQDITERKQAEKQVLQMKRLYATLSQVNQTIVRVRDHNELYQSICDVAVQFGEFSLAFIALLDESTGEVKPVASCGLDLASWPFETVNIYHGTFVDGLMATAVRTSSVITSEDVQTDQRTQKALSQIEKYEYHSSAAIPFQLRGKTIGVVSLTSPEIGLFKAEEEVSLIKEMGLDISFALDTMEVEAERKQAEEKLRESEEKYRSLAQELEQRVKERTDEVQSLYNDAPIGYHSLDINGHFIQINETELEWLGYSREELLGQPITKILTQASLAKFRETFRKFRKEGTLRSLELDFVRKDGSILPALVNADAVVDAGENYLMSRSVVFDNTERKKIEDELRASLNRVNALYAISQGGIDAFEMQKLVELVANTLVHALSADKVIVIVLNVPNRSIEYAIRSGQDFHEVWDISFDELWDGLSGWALREQQIVVSPHGSPDPRESESVRKRRKDTNAGDIIVIPIIYQDNLLGTLTAIHKPGEKGFKTEDVDMMRAVANQASVAIERMRAEINLRRANKELESANRAKSDFLATMSHELRTPLNSIIGLSESLLEQRREPLSEHQQQSLHTIEFSGRHLLELINDILDLSKIEAGKLDYYPQIVDVNNLCRSSMAFVKEQALRRSIDIVYEAKTENLKVYADPRRLKQVLVNLLSNAVKFTPEGGQVTLGVHTDSERDLCQFSVTDTGIGIAPDGLRQLFQPFVQVDSALNRQFEGTGLGLALVQRLADMHGGSVEVESELGKGSRFTVNVPWGQDAIAQQERIVLGEKPLPPETTHLPPSVSAQNGVILLVEDNETNVLMIGEYLQSHGYEVLNAYDGAEAIKKAEEINPDIILMDIQMPVIDGLEAIRRLRVDSRFISTPIIALTALAMPGDRERCIEAGANEYMSKPVGLKVLKKTIETWLQNKTH